MPLRIFQEEKREKRPIFRFFRGKWKIFPLFIKKKLELSFFRCILLMPWSAFADPGTKTTDAPQKRIRSCRKPPDPLKRMTAEPRPMRFAQSDGQGPVGFFCICRRESGTEHGAERTGTPRTAEAAPGITITTTNPAPGGTQ